MTPQGESRNYSFNVRFAVMFPSSLTSFPASEFMASLRSNDSKHPNAARSIMVLPFSILYLEVQVSNFCQSASYIERYFFMVFFSHTWQLLVD